MPQDQPWENVDFKCLPSAELAEALDALLEHLGLNMQRLYAYDWIEWRFEKEEQ